VAAEPDLPRADKVRGMTLGHDVGIKSTASADPISRLNIVRQRPTNGSKKDKDQQGKDVRGFAARAMLARFETTNEHLVDRRAGRDDLFSGSRSR